MNVNDIDATQGVSPRLQVSVIIPTFNRERFVTKAISSVLNQKFKDYEIIVIDDGSTDGTQQVLESFVNKIKLIIQPNSGVSSARNAGLRVARGQWVAFLDSDDEWTEDYLSTLMSQAEEFPHAVAHIANAVTVLPDGGRSSLFVETRLLCRFKAKTSLVFERPLAVIVKHAPWFLQASIMRRDVLLRAGTFNTELSIAEDLDVISRVALIGPFTFIRKELVEIYRREESIENLGAQSLRRGIYRYKSFGQVYANLLNYEDLTWLEKATIARALSRNRRALGNVLVMAGRKTEARHFFWDAFCRYPSVASLIKHLATFLPDMISRALVRSGSRILPGEDLL
jgi:glycosyltransferase involved in cell wall biosynthesis